MITIALYESPAARHMIDDWHREQAEAGRLRTWTLLANSGVEVAGLSTGEEVVMVPLVNGDITNRDWCVLMAPPLAPPGGAGRVVIDKLLLFGKVPINSTRFLLLMGLAGEADR